MQKKIILAVTGLFFLFLFFLYGGIGFDREWNDSSLFMKHKPNLQLFFKSTTGESDKSWGEEEVIYHEYFEKNRKTGFFTSIVMFFLQTSIICFLILAYLLIYKVKIFKLDKKNIALIIFYGILIKFSLYVFAWNIWGLENIISYIYLFLVCIIFDLLLFSNMKNGIVEIENE
ncbi:MAG: hypothetical protein GY714_29240 [Desulfobacterales bacterium]|nr:hypothetical protein [Desulfobacterales bacterium]MCP4162425.1 hypothetical protein [Deltaproteobacteria bacterium]